MAWTANPKEDPSTGRLGTGWIGIDKEKQENSPDASQEPPKAGEHEVIGRAPPNPVTYREHPRPPFKMNVLLKNAQQ